MNTLTARLGTQVALAAAILTLTCGSRSAFAGQSEPPGHPAADASVATNLSGVRAYLSPPAGFDPLTALADELRKYGFPPRPDAGSPQSTIDAWRQISASLKNRILPKLEQTKIFNGPFRKAPGRSPFQTDNSTATNSSNWSGYSVVDNNKPFANEEVFTQYVVPVAQQAFGACTGGWDYGSAWDGIDGFGSSDVLQAGIEFDAYCNSGSTSAYYSAWYEWYPFGEVRISNLPVAPGDLIRVYVWNTSPTVGNAVLVNFTANTSVSLTFNAPSGTQLQGNSVEWVVERPSVGGSLATLTNYIGDPFTFAEAFNTVGHKRYYFPGRNRTGTEYSITMVDSSNNPLSVVELQGLWDLWFYDVGAAV